MIWGEAIFVLFLVCSAALDILYIVVGRSPTTSNFIVLFNAQDFHPGDLCKG